MAMLGSLPPKTDHLDTTDIKAGGPGTHFIDVGLAGSGNAIRIDGTPGFINESHAYVGVNNGNFDTGETMTFSMVNSSGTALDFFGMDIGGKSAQGRATTGLPMTMGPWSLPAIPESSARARRPRSILPATSSSTRSSSPS